MIVVLDFGGQYCHLIARRIRQLNVMCEILPWDSSADYVLSFKPMGIILSGGPASVFEANAPNCNGDIFSLGLPILGICYGHQLISKHFGGEVVSSKEKEFGRVELLLKVENVLFCGLGERESVWFSHGDAVVKLPAGFQGIASTSSCEFAAIANFEGNVFGIQFHPEVVNTVNGMRLLENFVFNVCKCERNWFVGNLKDKLVEEIRLEVGNEMVLIGISGGIDSLVAGKVLLDAIGGRLVPVFVETGLLRKGERQFVEKALKEYGFSNLAVVDASKRFLDALTGVVDPEEKRRVVGKLFVEVFETAAEEISGGKKIKFLAQGTIYPDRIESSSASRFSSKIKTHHNLALPERFSFRILEPLKDFYKDEVRALGKLLGIEDGLLNRHPFPGPGLSVRILGEVSEEKLCILKDVDEIFVDELKKCGLYEKVWQAFAVLLPVKSVGVKGDSRNYSYVVALRAVTSVDGMTADWARLPYEFIERVSNRICNEVASVSRVLYDVSQKPPATIEFE